MESDRSLLVIGINGNLYAVDRTTGEPRWHNDLPGGRYGVVALAIGHGVVIASADGAQIFCLDYATGHTRWTQPTQARGRATLVMEADHVVCAKSGYLDCFALDGKKLWSQPLKGAGQDQIALGYPGNVVQADDIGRE